MSFEYLSSIQFQDLEFHGDLVYKFSIKLMHVIGRNDLVCMLSFEPIHG